MIFSLSCPAEGGVTEWLWRVSCTQAGPTHLKRPWLNPLEQRRELSLEIHHLSDFLYKILHFLLESGEGKAFSAFAPCFPH